MQATKFIQCVISNVSVANSVTVNGTAGVANRWNATLNVVAQSHSDGSTRNPFFYDGVDVNAGDYVTSSADGKVLKVASITSKTASAVVCVLEDEQNINALSDETGNLNGLIPNGASNQAYIFEAKNNAPILANIPAALPGNFAPTFAHNIRARFEAVFGAPKAVLGSSLSVGDGTSASDIDVIADNGAANKPRLRYKSSTAKWQYSNDGSTFTDLGAGYSHPTGDGNLHVPATGTTNNTKVLKAGATAGSLSWGSVAWSEIASKPTTLSGYGITDAQALDADLTAIAGLAGASGLLKKTAANTWALDTNTYLTANQSISIAGDATGSGTTSISLTLANSGVTAGTYPKVTVNAKGLVTGGASLAAADIPALDWGKITSGKPTTLSGYGITDAYTKTEVQGMVQSHFSVFNFQVNFTGSNPSSVSGLPTGWTASIVDSDITITHNVGKPLLTINYWGHSVSGGVENYRQPSSSVPATIPSANANTKFTFRITTAVAGADIDSYAKVVVGF
jgi:hypothetical protein